MPEIVFRPATLQDVELIGQLAERIWYAHYPSIVSMGQIEFMLAMMYSPDSLAQQMRQGHRFALVFEGEEPAGYFSVSETEPGHCFLHKFYIDTTKHRQGLGSAAFDYLVNNVCPNAQTITLQVNRRNIKAINFYFKKGFVIDRAEDVSIGNGYSMDDFFMVYRPTTNKKATTIG